MTTPTKDIDDTECDCEFPRTLEEATHMGLMEAVANCPHHAQPEPTVDKLDELDKILFRLWADLSVVNTATGETEREIIAQTKQALQQYVEAEVRKARREAIASSKKVLMLCDKKRCARAMGLVDVSWDAQPKDLESKS